MKNYLIILLFLTFAAACKKKTEMPSIVGKWEITSSINGLTGKLTNHPSGNGNIYIFTTTHYELFLEGKKEKSGTYSIVKKQSKITNAEINAIIFDNEVEGMPTGIELSQNGLTIFVDAYDGPSALYTRIN